MTLLLSHHISMLIRGHVKETRKLWVLLLIFAAVSSVNSAPPTLPNSPQVPRGTTRTLREVPDTSYALPQEDIVGFKLDIPEAEKTFNRTQESSPDGTFSYSYSADNGISVDVKGSQKQIGSEKGQVMEGRYSYTAPDGTLVSVQWFADETGYHASITKQAPGANG